MELKQSHHPWLTKLLGSTTVILLVVVLAVVGVAAFFGNKVYQRQTEMQVTQEMVLSNLRIMNEQTIVSEVIKEKLGDKLTPDQQAKLAFTIVDGCRKNSIPISLVLGLIEKESTWNPKAVSSMGAIGLMQCMPDTAIRHFKARGLSFSLESLHDPVLNVSIGIDILLDKHETAQAQGRASKEDYIWALFYYCGKGDTYAREVIALSVGYKKRLDTPVQDMLRRAQEQEKLQAMAQAAVSEKKVAKK